MLTVTINAEEHTLPEAVSIADLLERLGYDGRRVAVEVNQRVVPRLEHRQHRLARGDAIEIVTLVGGG